MPLLPFSASVYPILFWLDIGCFFRLCAKADYLWSLCFTLDKIAISKWHYKQMKFGLNEVIRKRRSWICEGPCSALFIRSWKILFSKLRWHVTWKTLLSFKICEIKSSQVGRCCGENHGGRQRIYDFNGNPTPLQQYPFHRSIWSSDLLRQAEIPVRSWLRKRQSSRCVWGLPAQAEDIKMRKSAWWTTKILFGYSRHDPVL